MSSDFELASHSSQGPRPKQYPERAAQEEGRRMGDDPWCDFKSFG